MDLLWTGHLAQEFPVAVASGEGQGQHQAASLTQHSCVEAFLCAAMLLVLVADVL